MEKSDKFIDIFQIGFRKDALEFFPFISLNACIIRASVAFLTANTWRTITNAWARQHNRTENITQNDYRRIYRPREWTSRESFKQIRVLFNSVIEVTRKKQRDIGILLGILGQCFYFVFIDLEKRYNKVSREIWREGFERKTGFQSVSMEKRRISRWK